MAEQEKSLAVIPPGMTPSLPTEIALHQMSRMQVKEPSPLFDQPGNEWVKAYFPKTKKRERSGSEYRSGVQSEGIPEAREEESQSELRSILLKLQRTATAPQAAAEPVVLYAEPEVNPKRKTFTPSKPTLDMPKVHYMKAHIDTILTIEKTSAKMIRSEETCIDWITGWISTLSNKLIEHIRDASEIFKQRETWSILAKVASGILAAISIVFGISLVATPAGGILVGGLLIASGFLSIVNLILEETKVWDWVATQIAGGDRNLRNQLRVWIPAGVGMLSMLVGGIGSVGALFMGAFDLVHKMLLMGKTATDIAKNIAQMAEGVASSESLKAQAETEYVQTQIDLTDTNLKGAIDTLKQISGSVKRSFSSAHRSLAGYARAAKMREIQG